ncbi:MAG: hypothetical protein ACYTEQ_22585 [Planctomycetota bacterium]|jgi:hypothetical protein
MNSDKPNIVVGPGDDIEAAFRRAQETGCAEISLTIPMPVKQLNVDVINGEDETVIDKLRMRGTPIELIHSYLIAEDEQAQSAFRTCILEAAYERIKAAFKDSATVLFETPNKLVLDGERHYRPFDADADAIFYGIALTPKHDDDICKKGSTIGHATVHTIDINTGHREINDSAPATIIGIIDDITERIEQSVVDRSVEAVSKHGQGHFTIGIVPAMCKTNIEMISHTEIGANVDIAVYAFYVNPQVQA